MSSQLQILQKTNSLAQKQYRFYLSNQSAGTIELSVAPDGWIKNEVEYQRSVTYHGVSRSVSVKELNFFKEARNFLQSVYESQGIDAYCLFVVNILDIINFQKII